MNVFKVPPMVKTVFDEFPLKNYGPLENEDVSLSKSIKDRKFYFHGEPLAGTSGENRVILGIYNVFEHPRTHDVLATDPWCLFVQFALCKKNLLKLPNFNKRVESPDGSKPCIGILSPLTVQDEKLPVLVEGYKKRYIRSCFNIKASIEAKLYDDPEEYMYMNLLDTVIYDHWMITVLFNISNEDFLKLYSVNQGKVDNFQVKDMKIALLNRNSFDARHPEIAYAFKSPTGTLCNKSKIAKVSKLIQDDSEKTMLQIQNKITMNQNQNQKTSNNNTKRLMSNEKESSPSYVDLKLCGYLLCILSLPETVPIHKFITTRCPDLISYTDSVLTEFTVAR
ncbi:hypothetical protein Kpol_1055p9 [Vanderwaltozyma polyspora DSM 70294]|uniref:Uncharacterized protein n=1 Tax=Vanderwaltozyma polyspora (strain ATCC 22028 / DSM 70294 / BCRC 21397 / CBS 2163 / NBRC 10782 / NRRL Y-8283 / UCD 57-17) TaxID=436907 RepID=A7TG83_VANPO|nr:uncharacterized protein Kpol_1055p9 [Vanderwaltozyma polyspora DSM 70294]EDO18653.1 hypothetical protein Kpol_1055p9 [Vanderwaltozyma polyspora DSM 70294]